jgi:electron transport complex protein RnfG
MPADRNPLLPLPILALIGALSLACIHLATNSRIEANRRHAADRIVLDALSLPADTGLRAALAGSRQILLARRQQQLVAIVVPVAAEGYVAPIELIVGIAPDGRVRGVRAMAHRETTGLGDRIDADKGDWLRQFIGRTLDAENDKAWDVRSAGGDFDQITGATVTSRAVIEAVHDALRYFAEHREQVLREAGHD